MVTEYCAPLIAPAGFLSAPTPQLDPFIKLVRKLFMLLKVKVNNLNFTARLTPYIYIR